MRQKFSILTVKISFLLTKYYSTCWKWEAEVRIPLTPLIKIIRRFILVEVFHSLLGNFLCKKYIMCVEMIHSKSAVIYLFKIKFLFMFLYIFLCESTCMNTICYLSGWKLNIFQFFIFFLSLLHTSFLLFSHHFLSFQNYSY